MLRDEAASFWVGLQEPSGCILGLRGSFPLVPKTVVWLAMRFVVMAAYSAPDP